MLPLLSLADADGPDWHLALHHRERHVHLLAPDGAEEGLQLLLVHPPALRPPLHFQPTARAGQESSIFSAKYNLNGYSDTFAIPNNISVSNFYCIK